jgi:hypothetical protein
MRIRRLTIAGVALVAAIGVAGCGPANDKASPAATVATSKPADAAAALAAAGTKASAQSLRVTMTMGGGISMSGVTDPKTKKSDMTMKLGALGGDARMLRVGDDMYMKFSNSAIKQLTGGKAWLHMNLTTAGLPLGTTDPLQAAKALESAASVQRVGDSGFKGTLDMSKVLAQSGQKAPASAPAVKDVPFTAKVDDQGRLVEMTMDMSGYSAQLGTMKATYSDFGTPVSVTAPAKSQVAEMPAQLKKTITTT